MKHESVISRIISSIFGNKIAVRENLFYDTEKSTADFLPNDLPNTRAVLAWIGGAGGIPTVITAGVTPTPKVVAYAGSTNPDYVLINTRTNLIDKNTNVFWDGTNFTIAGADKGDGTFSDSFTFAIKA